MKDLLSMSFFSQELNQEVTLKQYLVILAKTVWQEAEGFSGKRPWGNSSWQYEVYTAMIKNGFVAGKLDSDGYVEELDCPTADKMILAEIDKWLFSL